MPNPGDTFPAQALFYDSADELVDPTTPLVDIVDPDGNVLVTNAVPSSDAVGVFTYDYLIPLAGPLGTWHAHFTGTVEGGPVSGDDFFEVEAVGSQGEEFVTVARYRTWTGDITSTEAAITGALIDAQGLVEEYLRRWLTLGEHTETLRLIDGRVYPKGYPIASAGTLTVERGRGVLGAAISEPIWNVPLNGDSWATVTYTGGFTALTLPKTIEREIARTAYNVLHPSKIPAGALSVSQGDSSVTFKRAQTNGELDAVSKAALRPWRNTLP